MNGRAAGNPGAARPPRSGGGPSGNVKALGDARQGRENQLAAGGQGHVHASSTLVAPSPALAHSVAVVSTVSQTPHGGIHTTGRCLCASSRPRAGGQALSSESPIEGIA